MKTLLHVSSVWGCTEDFFFFLVSEQVDLNHERRPYGKIEKNTKSLHPTPGVSWVCITVVWAMQLKLKTLICSVVDPIKKKSDTSPTKRFCQFSVHYNARFRIRRYIGADKIFRIQISNTAFLTINNWKTFCLHLNQLQYNLLQYTPYLEVKNLPSKMLVFIRIKMLTWSSTQTTKALQKIFTAKHSSLT